MINIYCGEIDIDMQWHTQNFNRWGVKVVTRIERENFLGATPTSVSRPPI